MDNGSSRQMGETVYSSEDTSAVMSEKVQSLAGSIYQEFERMIQRYDEDVVKTLMPLLVNVLECLDASYQQNQEQDVELELLREDNEQLVTQYEREKVARKQAEQKLLDTEDLAEAENKELASRLESLESIVRMLELKHKNSLEHASRLEEREGELKKEYNKLHERYTELFKTHVDYMERTKLIMGNSTHSLHQSSASERIDMNRSMRLNPITRSSGPISFGFASLENSVAMLDTETICSGPSSASGSGPPSLQNEIDIAQTVEKSSETDQLQQINQATSPQSDVTSPTIPQIVTGRSTTKSEKRSANTLYQELSFQDDALESEENEITGIVHPGEYASSVNDNFFGMGKEVENLIMENNELLATKNALNIVKDDLIVKVDELTGELEILREELNAVIQSRNKLKAKVGELEEDLRKAKDQIKQQTSEHENDDSDVPMAQRKRFTRVEMARVLMERNQYKERFMELQDAVRWTEMMRATKVDQLDKKSKQSIWKFFSNLFSSNDRPQREPPPLFRSSSPSSTAPIGEGRSVSQFPAIGAASTSNSFVLTANEAQSVNDGTSERAMARRREQYRQVRAHVQKEDGRLQAYGWSLPSTTPKVASQSGSNQKSNVHVPVPVYCRPLAEASPHMKVWCASGVNLNGGFTRDGGCVVGASVFYSRQQTAVITDITTPTNEAPPSELDSLDKQMKLAMDQVNEDQQLSSFVWICTSTHAASTVTVIDAKNPAEVLDSFPICQTHLLCICTVMGALEMDYHMLDNSEATKSGEMLEKPGEPGDSDELGKVEFIRVPPQQIIEQQQENDGDIEKASEASPDIDEDENNQESGEMNPTSVGPTMWMGAQNGMVYVHSSVGRWRVCLHAVQLPDAVLSIVHVCGRVVIALANGKVAVFRRQTNGEWDVNAYHLITLGSPKQSVRCLAIVGDKVWAAHRNRIHVIDPISLNIIHTLEAHPRKESQVRQMAATGLGVWVSIRLDSTLRLYHSQTYEHLQDVDIEPYVSKMLGTGKLGFSFVRITSLHVSCGRLWIGTGNGVIISVILNGDGNSSSIPKCCMAHSQLSFHGHRDAVKFFVSVPMNPPIVTNEFSMLNKHHQDMLVMSGGEGYIDFRLGDGDMENSIVLQPNQTIENRGDKSYLIVWQI
ncbi:hypothetical protein PVAND_007170 [Polypedilum vanderplanki]|uniref:JNK-interacting protein 3 n=1 Tax=Polypedilum vanderplanki TaxID=319348 RepID=A0A9J6C5V4_POLVA|nr:hypothetical protein PVAND_007170 [Polypedilum vanderplanki]